MKAVWSFYDAVSGAISSRVFMGSDRILEANTPAGMVAIEGRLDHLSQRVDVTTGEVVDYQPPQPDDEHEWNSERRRWVKRADVLEAERRDAAARKRIAELEQSQLRAMREQLLGRGGTAFLQDIDDEIAMLRSDLIPAKR